ncbi:HesA/MoeB/ThiF family protein [Cystobacter ferrugineus]|uniref:Thiamine biosynthesis protein ThiF n=1 Tax=Cystobacter ferrugineus TaxID=83449 RepID=A0A1L9B6C4_9BACT|nr:HesA/MoeB/ThiF family protein [Cystobacter ferrugineus]OJH37805.1 thiamine biosynthesis protein ThiF [Cystobacter ferrugineus]
MSRYARQTAVLGEGAQERLRAARILVVGAGGLGAPVLQYLVGAGVGHIRLVDPDRVEESNLHRQTLFRMSDLGQPKAEACARHLAGLNPESVVEPVVAALEPANAPKLIEGRELILDCADSFAVSYILSDLCLAWGLPFLSASVTGREGHAGGFCGGAPSLRAVFPELPQRVGSCADTGVLGPVVGVIGALQAQMALALLAGEAGVLGRLVTFDAATFRAGGFRFDGAEEPAHAPRFVSPSEIEPGDLTIDLRGAEEAPLIHPAARRLSVAQVGPGMDLPEPGQRAVLVCRSGLRAWRAAERLAAIWPGDIALVAAGEPVGTPS